jgi:hypothetical protein
MKKWIFQIDNNTLGINNNKGRNQENIQGEKPDTTKEKRNI